MKHRFFSRRPPVAVVELREDLEDLRAEVGHLGRQLRALQEREAVLNSQVLHLARYTSGGNGAAAHPELQKRQEALQEAVTSVLKDGECLETSGVAKGAVRP